MIISLSGRLRSGKGEMANICAKKGFKRMYFALPLKELCADLLDVSVDELNKLKNNNTTIDISCPKDFVDIVSERTDVPHDVVETKLLNKHLHTVREMLQFIGTDIIRKYDQDWHVNKIMEMIEPNKNYVFEDTRFPNEKKLIEELGGDCWFIVRPEINNVSNHLSETALKWQDFGNNVIINDDSFEFFKFTWDNFFSMYEKSKKTRDKIINKIISGEYKILFSEFTTYDALFISKQFFDYKKIDFNKDDIESVTKENNFVKVKRKDNTFQWIGNALNIEDLKFYL